ncbi:hypothetical protein KL86DES1_21546 [uncultured Desulfovibrio sp.]|uniref:Uncharacterized protein n=1 Tax=uncultured Desulfovibrio sp. TaxID=167968 RepID=A0A212L8Z8_9BACT|nr:hypothetical protein KL86DES1_21546 [uncultured Desulfovibrio sp.]VZH34446.1 conserved protein of unknown function [Desulfovibrio sp. 86]
MAGLRCEGEEPAESLNRLLIKYSGAVQKFRRDNLPHSAKTQVMPERVRLRPSQDAHAAHWPQRAEGVNATAPRARVSTCVCIYSPEASEPFFAPVADGVSLCP